MPGNNIIRNIRLTATPQLIGLYTFSPLAAFATYHAYAIYVDASSADNDTPTGIHTLTLAIIILLLLLPFGASTAERSRLRTLGYEQKWTKTILAIFTGFCVLENVIFAAVVNYYWVDESGQWASLLPLKCLGLWVMYVLHTLGPIWVLTEPVCTSELGRHERREGHLKEEI